MADIQVLGEVERRIVVALQVDGRATWRKIAKVIGEPERTVARYGSALLDEGKVKVAAIAHRKAAVIASLKCAPGTIPVAIEAISQRSDTSFTYMVTGESDVVSELHYDGGLEDILTLQLPATPGLSSIQIYPILKYFKTVRAWRAGSLSDAQEAALTPSVGGELTTWNPADGMTDIDRLIVEVLRNNGRASIDSISRQVRMSETSVSRRVDALLRGEHISIRTLVDPALMGFQVEALLRIQVSPASVDADGNKLKTLPQVRYVAAVAGDAQLLVEVTVASQRDLYEFIAATDWGEMVQLRTSMVLGARKRGGRMVEELRYR
ncbi:Lrp/AsnC family transcriptional regulator [Glutamicibacter sp. AOP5-A2-18]|uniref:Lrp/AsnC family transcriptional regulator n=1 Tax=Glutamicibacter sp. AOP5-A2-18 TaxID=3457656 RepID=UPI004033A509